MDRANPNSEKKSEYVSKNGGMSKKTTKVVKGDPRAPIGQRTVKTEKGGTVLATKATITLDNGYDAKNYKVDVGQMNVQFEKVKKSNRPNYDALPDEVKKNHNLAMNYVSKIIEYSSPVDGSDTFCFPLMYHAIMTNFLNYNAVEVIEAKFKDLKASLNVSIDFDKLNKYDVIYNSLMQRLRSLEKGISRSKKLKNMMSDQDAAKCVDNDELFKMLSHYKIIIQVFENIFNDRNLKYSNAWIEDELNDPAFISKLMSAAPGLDFTLLKNKRTHIYVRTLPSSIRLYLEVDKEKYGLELEIDGSKLCISKMRPEHVLGVGDEKREISKLPQDFIYLITEIFTR